MALHTHPVWDVSCVDVTESPSADDLDPGPHGLIHRVLHIVEILPNQIISKGIGHVLYTNLPSGIGTSTRWFRRRRMVLRRWQSFGRWCERNLEACGC